MKSIFFSLLFILSSLFSFSQNEEYTSTITLNAAYSIIGGLIDVADVGSLGTARTFAYPAVQLNYDFGAAKWFSIGPAISYQLMGVEYIDYEGTGEDFTTKIGRLNFAVRPLFHYANNGRLDMYSGFRVGVTKWSLNTDSSSPDYDPYEDVTFSRNGFLPSFQLVLWGFRGYVTPNIGLNMELALGSPHLFSGGLNYRF